MRGRPGFDRRKRVGQFNVGYVFFFFTIRLLEVMRNWLPIEI